MFLFIIIYSEVMKTLLNRYRDKLGLTQDQISEIEVNVKLKYVRI